MCVVGAIMSDRGATKEPSLAGAQFRRSPVAYVLALIAFVNWFMEAPEAAGYAVKLFLLKCRNRRSWHVINVKLRELPRRKNKNRNAL